MEMGVILRTAKVILTTSKITLKYMCLEVMLVILLIWLKSLLFPLIMLGKLKN